MLQLQPGQVGPSGLPDVHGVLHELSAEQLGRLSNMEHEYWPLEVQVELCDGSGPVTAVAYVSPPDRVIKDDLPTTTRCAVLVYG